jgi:hypothetical protein
MNFNELALQKSANSSSTVVLSGSEGSLTARRVPPSFRADR